MDGPKIFDPFGSEPNSHLPPRHAADYRAARLSSVGRANLVWVDVRQLVDDVCAQFKPPMKAAGIEATVDVPCDLGVLADPELLRLAVAHLVSNALEAMPAGGRLVITSYCGQRDLELEIGDSGPGLSADALGRAFEPFYTTKENRSGLGLALVRRVAQAHGGDVVAVNCPEGGAAFTLRFPARARQSAA